MYVDVHRYNPEGALDVPQLTAAAATRARATQREPPPLPVPAAIVEVATFPQ